MVQIGLLDFGNEGENIKQTNLWTLHKKVNNAFAKLKGEKKILTLTRVVTAAAAQYFSLLWSYCWENPPKNASTKFTRQDF